MVKNYLDHSVHTWINSIKQKVEKCDDVSIQINYSLFNGQKKICHLKFEILYFVQRLNVSPVIMSKVPVASDSSSVDHSTNDILRFDLGSETKEEHGDRNIGSIPDTVSPDPVYPSIGLEGDTSDNSQLNEDDVLEELAKLENLRDKKLPIFTCGDVELYFIEPNGDVKSTFEKNKLIVFKLDGDPAEIIFLEVGNWVYPLFSVVNPCYKSEEGIFVFPDIYSEVENASVGLILPRENCEAFHEVLCYILDDSEASRTRRSTAADAPSSIPQNLNSGTLFLAQNLIRASKSLASGMDCATSKIVTKIQPKASSSVNPKVESLAHAAASVTGQAANVTGYLSSTLGHAVTALGRYVTPYISRKLQENVPHGAVDITLGTLRGIGNIYNGLEESAEILAHSMSNNAVKLVEHSYGQPVGRVTSDVLSTVKNIYAARRNASVWKPKSIAKGVLRSTGQALLEDRRELKQTQSLQGLQRQTGPDPLSNL